MYLSYTLTMLTQFLDPIKIITGKDILQVYKTCHE